jgi:hypothetical protein
LGAEGAGGRTGEEFAEGGVVDIAVRVRMILIIATRQDIAVGGNHYPTPDAETTLAKRFAVPESVGMLLVAAVAGLGGHERMTMAVVVELGGLEDQSVRAEGFVLLPEGPPLVLVGAEAENLQLDSQTSFGLTD